MAKILPSIFKRLRLELLTLISLSIISLTVIILLCFVPFILVYRSIVKLIVKCGRPDLTHMLQLGNSFFALEDITKRSKATILGSFVLDRSISIDELTTLFQSRVLNKRRISKSSNNSMNSRPLYYPELQETWTTFMGYQFWKREANFNIGDHIRICDYEGKDGYKLPEICTTEDLQNLCTRLLSAPWKREISPWEVLIVPKYEDTTKPVQFSDWSNNSKSDYNDTKIIEVAKQTQGNQESWDEEAQMKCVVILRFHHALGDGKGWMQLVLQDLLASDDLKLPISSKEGKRRNPLSLLLAPIRYPYDFAKNRVEAIEPPGSPWRPPSKRSHDCYTSFSSPIPVQYVKDLKNKFGTSYSAILATAISGAIRRVMMEAGQKVPKTMECFLVLPLPNHPGGICIHASGMYLSWPIGTEGPVERLKEVIKDMEAHKSSTYPQAVQMFISLYGLFPNFVRRSVYNKVRGSITASLFPGPMETPQFSKSSFIDAFFYLGIPTGQLGASVGSVVVGGKQRVVVTVDKTLFPSQEEFTKLGGFMDEEFQVLGRISAESFHHGKGENIV